MNHPQQKTTKPQFIENDPAVLAAYIASLGDGLIVFDGRPGAGKSYLARTTAKRIGCAFIEGDDFLVGDRGMFLGALRIDDLRRAIEVAATPPVLLATVCARHVADRTGLPIAAFIWVEQASLVRLDQIRRDYFDYDENSDSGRRHPLYKEVEAYIAACDARRTPDVVYLNAPD
jgi:hypothetical protein